MIGRIESYIHSDSITGNKGGAIVKVLCQTDFAARTAEFIAFCKLVANRAYGATADSWNDVTNVFPEMTTEFASLSEKLKEQINVVEIVVLKL